MTAQERLLKYYQDAYAKLLRKIASSPGADWNRYYKRLLAEIDKSVADLDKAAASKLAEITQKAYTAAESKALAAIEAAAGPFGGKLNRGVMQLIAENAVDQLTNANHYFGRQLSDSIRQIGLDAIGEKVATGQTVREAQRRIVERLKAEGMTTVTGGAGKKYRLDSYAELVARTTTREATNTGTTATAEQLGYDLVKFTTHYPTCDVCAPIQGRVFSISDKDKRFPALSSVPGFDKGFKTLHPNCRHVLVVTVEALWTDEERAKYLAAAGQPVRGDTRAATEVDRYNTMQAEKRERWQDRRQYERYKAVMGDEAPKTFSAFRGIKRADGDAYKELKGFYRYKIDNPTAAKVHYRIYNDLKSQGIRNGQVVPAERVAAYIIPADKRPYHAMQRMLERHITDDDVRAYITNADTMLSQWKGDRRLYITDQGATVIGKNTNGDWIVMTTWSKREFDEVSDAIIRTVKKYV
jgi:hypothetical protein